MSVRLGAETARDQLLQPRMGALALVASAVVVAAGLALRSPGTHGADRSLLDVTLSIVVPLACFALFDAAHRRRSTQSLLAPLARHGADRRKLALGFSLVLLLGSAALTAILAVLAVLSASASLPGLARDAFACAWGGALAGAAYAGLFALGSRRGRGGRILCLLGDWMLGSGTGVLALPWARGHARNLLGGEAVLAFSPWLAAGALAVLAALYTTYAASRGPR